MTKAQREMLELIGACKREYVPHENNFGSKARMCDRLVKMGLVSNYVHGGYEITEAGRALLTPYASAADDRGNGG